jgi:LuxR family maltose regulon positive regulatory protein
MGTTGQRERVILSPRKFEAARQPRTAITRDRLLDRLVAAGDARLVLVSAPAGSGKSVLLEQWVAGMRRPEWAWVSLEAADQDVVRFWACVAESICRSGHEPAEHTWAVLDDGIVEPSTVASAVAADIAASPGLRVLVLDDFHLAAGVQTEAGVALLAELLPSGVQLAIGTRSDPKLPLHRWRLRGELCELRADDLRFREDEAESLLSGGHDLVLDAGDRDRLLSGVEGWAAGLQLAALSLAGGGDVPALLDRFAATHQPLLDFLATEVLDRQPGWRRRFLQGAACVGEFCPAVLDAVLDRDDSGDVLRHLRSDNLFLVPLGHWPGWYRFHHLFGQFLQYDLHVTDPGRETELHRRAGLWMRENGHPSLAIDHLVDAGELADALAVVDGNMVSYFDRGRRTTIRRWMERFPEDFIAERPSRCVIAGTAWMTAGSSTQAMRWFDRWDRSRQGTDPVYDARAQTVVGPIRLFLGDAEGCVQDVDNGVKEMAAHPWLAYASARIVCFAARAQCLLGDLDEADALLDRAMSDAGADRLTLELLAPGMRALVAIAQGRLRAADDLATHAAAAEQALQGSRPFSVPALLARGLLALERDDLPAAEALGDRLRQAAAELGHWNEAIAAYLLLADVHQANDELERALDDVDQARSLVRELRMGDPLGQHVDAAEAAVRIAGDDLEPAARLLMRVGPGWRDLLEAQLCLARGDADGAYMSLTAAPVPATLPRRIDREVLLAVAAAGSESERSAHHIDRALAAGESEGFGRTVLGGRLGRRHRDTVGNLVVAASRRRRSDYALKLLQVSEPPLQRTRPPTPLGTPVLVDPLTPAEQRVLFYLASSLTVTELAGQLGVSPNTVKSQMKGVYRKLAVGSRDAAIERARELGLR